MNSSNPLKTCFKSYEKRCIKSLTQQIKKIQETLEDDQVLKLKTHSQDGKKILKVEWEEFEQNVQESPDDLLGYTTMKSHFKLAIQKIESDINKFMISQYIGFDDTLTKPLSKCLNCTIKRTGIHN